jgi:hypothetical protein
MSKEEKSVSERKFEGFSVMLERNPVSKKRGSNRLSLYVDSDRSQTTIHLSLREARSLRKFLNDEIKDEPVTKDPAPSETTEA